MKSFNFILFGLLVLIFGMIYPAETARGNPSNKTASKYRRRRDIIRCDNGSEHTSNDCRPIPIPPQN